MSHVDLNETPIRQRCIAFCLMMLIALLLPTGCDMPAQQGIKGSEQDRKMECTNNIKQIALAMHVYYDVNHCLPPVYTVDKNGKPLHSWRVLFLPHLQQEALYGKIRLDEPWDSEHNKQFHSQMPTVYCCPSADGDDHSMTGYSVVVGEETIFGDPTTKISFGDLKDGASNTIFLVERKKPVCWMDPTQEITFEEACKGVNVSEKGIGSNHSKGMNVGVFDGSMQFIPDTVDPKDLRGALTHSGGESGRPF